MNQYYELITAAVSPLSLANAKLFLKVTSSSDDAVIQVLIDAVTEWAEKYLNREIRVRNYILHLDCFEDRIPIKKNPIDTVNSIKYFVSSSLTTVSSTVYYVKNTALLSEILLVDGEEWPTNGDEREHLVQIDFTTKAHNCTNLVLQGMKQHLSYLYYNRGDCGEDIEGASELSGATKLYNVMRIPNV